MNDKDWQRFLNTSAVVPLNTKPRARTGATKPSASARNRQRDEWRALVESRAPNEAQQLEASGDEFSYLRPNSPAKYLERLKSGGYSIRDSVDLHGLNVQQAEQLVYEFVAHSVKHGNLCIRIIHGKGLGSFNRRSPLKEMLPVWLMRMRAVTAFCTAPTSDGGTGVTYVLLS